MDSDEHILNELQKGMIDNQTISLMNDLNQMDETSIKNGGQYLSTLERISSKYSIDTILKCQKLMCIADPILDMEVKDRNQITIFDKLFSCKSKLFELKFLWNKIYHSKGLGLGNILRNMKVKNVDDITSKKKKGIKMFLGGFEKIVVQIEEVVPNHLYEIQEKPNILIHCYTEMSYFYENVLQNEKCIEVLRKATKLLKNDVLRRDFQRKDDFYDLCMRLGGKYRYLDRYKEAVVAFHEILNTLISSEIDKKKLLCLYSSLADSYHMLLNYEQSDKYFIKGESLCNQIPMCIEICEFYDRYSCLLVRLGRTKEELKLMIKVRNILEQNFPDEKSHLTSVYCHLGYGYARNKQFEKADRLLKKGIKLACLISNHYNVDLGYIYFSYSMILLEWKGEKSEEFRNYYRKYQRIMKNAKHGICHSEMIKKFLLQMDQGTGWLKNCNLNLNNLTKDDLKTIGDNLMMNNPNLNNVKNIYNSSDKLLSYNRLRNISKNNLCFICKEKGKKLLKCSRCKKVYYCSKKCQKIDWKNHKLICKKNLISI